MMVTLEDGTQVLHRHNMGWCKPDCFGCKADLVHHSSAAMPTRKVDFNNRREFEQQQEKDIPAYRRLKADGLQPKATRGAAELEARAQSRWEVETGQRLEGNERFAGNAAKIGRKLDELQTAVAKGEQVTV